MKLLQTGNIDEIVDLLGGFRWAFKNGFQRTYIVLDIGSAPKAEAAYREVQNTSASLTDTQLKLNAAGYRNWALGTNRYGWAVGCTMASNIGGGPWAQTARGATLEDCIKYGYAKSLIDENVFSVAWDKLPEEVRDRLIVPDEAAVGGKPK